MALPFSGCRMEDMECTKQAFPEYPDMLFGENSEGIEFFNAAALLEKKGLSKSLAADFLKCCGRFIDTFVEDGQIPKSRHALLDMDENLLLHSSLTYLFLCFIDGDFLLHVHDRIGEMFDEGLAFSDTYLAQLAMARLTPSVLREIAGPEDGGEDQQED